MTEVRTLSPNELLREAHEAGLAVPIEQTPEWAAYEKTIPGRSAWGCVALVSEGEPRAFASLTAMDTHGYRYLRSLHGPFWVEPPSAELEAQLLEALCAYVKNRERNVAFLRLAVAHELPVACPVLSTVPYDSTVVMRLFGGDEEAILSAMKPRGRRDVRKAIRECPAVFFDETERAAEDFGEYYEVMRDTAERDGFVPAPASDYEDLLRILGPEHSRLFASRVDGQVRAWTLATMNDGHAVRYYAASASDTRRLHIPDRSLLDEALALAALGCSEYDLMGIGSDFAPSLKGLNEFKTKFCKEVAQVPPQRDLPLRKTFYKGLVAAKGLRSKLAR